MNYLHLLFCFFNTPCVSEDYRDERLGYVDKPAYIKAETDGTGVKSETDGTGDKAETDGTGEK